MASNQKMQEKNLIQNLISQWKIGDQFRFSKFFQISDSMGYPNMHVLYFREGLGTRVVSEMMLRRYIGNISVCRTDI